MFRLPLFMLLAATLLVLAPAPHTTAQPVPAPVQLLADLNTGTESSQFGEAVTLGPLLYFVRYVDNSGELWRSDGSAEGTVVLYRFGPNVSPSNLTLVGGTLYFSVYADMPQPRRELWRSDGTPAGTTLVQSFPDSNGPRNLAAVGGQLLFFTNNMLWRSDGTPGGALMVKQFDPAVYQYATLATAERLFFVPGRTGGFDGPGSQLWVSDGSAEGTAMLREFDPTPGAPAPAPPTALRLLATHQGALYLNYERDGIMEIWRSDGTAAGTLRLGPSIVGDRMYSLGDGLYFTVDSQLWRGDGTPTGSAMLFDIDPTDDVRGRSTIDYLTSLGGLLFFTGVDSRYGAALWRSDGTAAGTALVSDAFSIVDYVPLRLLPAASDKLFLFANDGTHGNELWRSDGTPEGTSLVVDLTTSGASSLIERYSSSIIIDGDRAFFNAYGSVQGDMLSNLWVSDGTSSGTSLVTSSLQLARGFTLDDQLVFTRYDQPGLWVSDGTAAGTTALYTGYTAGRTLYKAAGRVFFKTLLENDATSIWVSDGTRIGTYKLFTLPEYVQLITTPTGVYFLYGGDNVDCRLRFSDGTLDGTTATTPLPINCEYMSALGYGGGLIYFRTYDIETSQATIWVSDGTAAGTRSLITFDTYRFILILSSIGDQALFFRIDRDRQNFALLRSDGTSAGTLPFISLTNRTFLLDPAPIAVEKQIFFTIASNTNWELWRTDGTAAGTILVRSWARSLFEDLPFTNATALGDLLLFAGEDGEPWLSDGTPAGTYRLHDVNPGPAGSAPFGFSLAGRRLLFAADDGSHGHEPWVSTPGLALVGPSAVAAADGEAVIDLRLQEISLAAGSTVTLSVMLDPALTYLGNDQELSPTRQGEQLVFSWQVASGPLHLAPLRLRIGLPADAPTDLAYRATLAASSSDPADDPADNRLSVELRRVYRTFAPLVAQ